MSWSKFPKLFFQKALSKKLWPPLTTLLKILPLKTPITFSLSIISEYLMLVLYYGVVSPLLLLAPKGANWPTLGNPDANCPLVHL